MRQQEAEQKAAEEPKRSMSTPAAQGVADFVAASNPEIDKTTVVNAGAEEAGKKAVAEDPGLKAKQVAIDKKVQLFAHQEQMIQKGIQMRCNA